MNTKYTVYNQAGAKVWDGNAVSFKMALALAKIQKGSISLGRIVKVEGNGIRISMTTVR